jgi:hypothetical protein
MYSNTIDSLYKRQYLDILNLRLSRFRRFNPNFGRKIYTVKYGKVSGFTFNEKHIEYSDKMIGMDIKNYYTLFDNKDSESDAESLPESDDGDGDGDSDTESGAESLPESDDGDGDGDSDTDDTHID